MTDSNVLKSKPSEFQDKSSDCSGNSTEAQEGTDGQGSFYQWHDR